jgi:PleD family two-component response regulator
MAARPTVEHYGLQIPGHFCHASATYPASLKRQRMNERMNLRRMETAAAPGLAVLIVDDDPRIRRLLGVKLRSDGCITYEAADGFEALQILSLSSWNAVILDLNMPGMDGEEFF